MTSIQDSPRDVAVRALRDRSGNVTAHLERLLDSGRLAPADRALAAELTLGCVRHRQTLAKVLHAYLAQPGKRIPGVLNEILEVALYQVLFLDRVPDFAAVNEAVEQAARFRHRRKSGLVNGVLRTITRGVTDVQAGAPPHEPDVVPMGPGTYRRMDRPVFADPGRDPAGHLAEAMSLPRELAARWIKRLGPEQALALAHACNVRPPMILRVNRLRADVPGVLASLRAEGVDCVAHENGRSVALAQRVDLTRLEAFRQGMIQPQDATPTAVVVAADPKPGMNVLDLCAAPGTKTTYMAELMDNQGAITATDVSDEKIRRIEDNCRRLGVDIVRTIRAEQAGSLEPRSFDLVLVDAPCSNTGVLARRPEARWRFDPEALDRLVADQKTLAAVGGNFVRSGGTLVYSTCSVEPEECGQVREHLRRTQPGLTPVAEELILPGGVDRPEAWHDGGYYAVLRAT